MAGKFRTALTALATLSVPGVVHNFDVDSTPERLTRASLPALIVLPFLDALEHRRFSEFNMATPTGSIGLAHYYCTHMLLYAPLGGKKAARSLLPGLTDLLDNYATVMRLNSKLGGALFMPIDYLVIPAPITWASGLYFGARMICHITLEV